MYKQRLLVNKDKVKSLPKNMDCNFVSNQVVVVVVVVVDFVAYFVHLKFQRIDYILIQDHTLSYINITQYFNQKSRETNSYLLYNNEEPILKSKIEKTLNYFD